MLQEEVKGHMPKFLKGEVAGLLEEMAISSSSFIALVSSFRIAERFTNYLNENGLYSTKNINEQMGQVPFGIFLKY